MKNINFIMMLVVAILVGNSCSDWLYIEPEDGITVDDYWQSEQDVHAAVMGAYASMLGGVTHPVGEAVFNWGELRADMVKSFRSVNNDFQAINQGEILPNNGMLRWDGVYRTINLCNTVLEKGPEVLDVDPAFSEEQWDRYKGEMLGLRALMHFYLTRTFRDVPLIVDATTSDANIARHGKTSQSQVFEQIVADLAQAEELVPLRYDEWNDNKGRITYYGVKTIQADVYLWLNEFDAAIDACNAVIESGQYALVPGNDDWFFKLFVQGNSVEGIFELQYSRELFNPYYDWMASTRYYQANVGTVEELWPVNLLTLPEDADIRSDGASYRSADGYSIWKYIGANREQAKPANEATSNWIFYRYADVLLMKAEALANVDRGTEALPLIQQVRERGNAADDTYQSPTGQYGLTSYIVAERGREFAFEGKRWFDIIRNARRNNYQRMDLITDMAIRAAPALKLESVLSKFNDPDFHYLPIHQSEIEAGYPDLKQNPFYEGFQE